MAIIVGLLILWVVLVAVGFVFKALLWLAVIGLLFFVGTIIAGSFYVTKSRQ